MRLIVTIILFLFTFCLNAQVQRITVKEQKVTISKLLKRISKQANVEFSYNSKLIDKKKSVSFNIENSSLDQVLTLLANTINVNYEQFEDLIILTRKETETLGSKPPVLKSPKKITISGTLTDQSNGESLINAIVAVKGTSKGVFTNAFGFYSLPLTVGTHTLIFNYIGYDQQEQEITIKENQAISRALAPSQIDLPAVTVGLPVREILNNKLRGVNALSAADLNNFPEFGGESSLTKGLQSLPGMKMHSDGSSAYYSRGGERDQNLILIDDAPIYNPSHLFGFYSIVIPDFTKSITVYQDDMPAALGDQLSSIISIRTKDGNLNKLSLGGSVNPFMARFSLELPIVKQRSSLFFTFRRSSLGFYSFANAQNFRYQFHDFHLKWNLKISKKNRVYFTMLQIADLFENKSIGINRLNWGNFAAALRWNYIISPKLFTNTTIYTGTYAFHLNLPGNLWKSELGNLSFKSDFTHYVNDKMTSKFGFENQGYFILPGETSRDSSLAFLPKITPDYSGKSVLYYQTEYQLNEQWSINAGLRCISWKNNGPETYFEYDDSYQIEDTITVAKGLYNSFNNVDPRISVNYSWNGTNQFKLSYGRYHQYLQILSNTVSPFSFFEIWQPANTTIKPQVSSHYVLSYLKLLKEKAYEVNTTAYYKRSQNIIDYAPNSILLDNTAIEGTLRQGNADAYGLEMGIKKNTGKLTGSVSYNYARVFRKTEGLNNDQVYRALQDRPHELSIVANYDLTKRIQVSSYWTSFSGATFSSPTSYFEYNNQTIPMFDELNNDRLPFYHRMDLSLKFQLQKKRDNAFKHSLMLSVYNVIGHKNTYAVKFNKLEKDFQNPPVTGNVLSMEQQMATEIDMIRFFPSLTYKFKLND